MSLQEQANLYRYHLRQALSLKSILERNTSLNAHDRFEINSAKSYFESKAKELQTAYREWSGLS